VDLCLRQHYSILTANLILVSLEGSRHMHIYDASGLPVGPNSWQWVSLAALTHCQ